MVGNKRRGSALVVVLAALLGWWLTSCGGEPVAQEGAEEGASPSASVSSPTYGSSYEPSAGPTFGQGPDDRSTRHGEDPESGLPWISEAELPPEAVDTLELIDAGGPFPYPDKDGSTFGNFEGILPEEDDGYYAEYTVPTPGSPDRGARRIVAGDGGEFYYTEDHYESFSRIDR